jgi:uncharacterized protein YkwD
VSNESPTASSTSRTRISRSAAILLLSALLTCPASVVADAGPACLPDDALSTAAASLLLAAGAPDSDTLVAAVRDAGSDAVRVHALFQPSEDPTAAAQWLTDLRAQADATLVCGDARGSAGRLLIASARGGTLAPLLAASSVVRGTLAPGFDKPELVISAADGRLTRLGLEPTMLRDGVPLAEELERPAKIQLVARGGSGPRPVAERILPSVEPGQAAPLGGSMRPSIHDAVAEADPARAAQQLVVKLNELRRSREALEVRPNRVLASVAQEHASVVCTAGRLAHELEPGRNPEVRAQEAGIRARLVGETIARAPEVGTAFHQFADSPSHLLTLLEPRFTDAGVGVARDGTGRACVVVLLAAFPRYVGR